MRCSVRRLLYTGIIVSAAIARLHAGESSIKTQWVEYTSGADTVKAFLAKPDMEGPFPAVILIHEWYGLNEWIQDNAKEFAQRGYTALAIDLYRGKVATSSDEAHELMRGLPEDRVVKDLRAAFNVLRERDDVYPDRIGTIGWCMGGGYALAAATAVEGLAAAVVCYGRILSEPEEIKKITCPVLGIFGEKDRGIPAASVKTFERQAQQLDKNVRVAVYPNAGHAFMNPNNKGGYNEQTAAAAWQRIFAFFDSKLQPKK